MSPTPVLTAARLKPVVAPEALWKSAIPVSKSNNLATTNCPLMESAKVELEAAIHATAFNSPICPVYQNVSASAVISVEAIKDNLIAQLTAPVRWTQSVQAMVADGAIEFIECGPGKVLQGLVSKIHKEAVVGSV